MDACTNTIIAGPAGSNIQACVDACTGIRSCLGAKGGSSKDAQFNLITAKTITYYGGTYSVGSNNDTYCMWFNGEINGEEVHMGCDYIGAANPADKAA
ncbi:MAG: hypothetical protein H6766_03340 [Candidatus Peribacteria bacterium]|nr:MAG: hypothetical protein H6766_03340 [Candidatus Peribacteria bacterium]